MLIYERGRGKGYRGATTAAAAASHVIDSNHIKLIASAQLISKEPHTHTTVARGGGVAGRRARDTARLR